MHTWTGSQLHCIGEFLRRCFGPNVDADALFWKAPHCTNTPAYFNEAVDGEQCYFTAAGQRSPFSFQRESAIPRCCIWKSILEKNRKWPLKIFLVISESELLSFDCGISHDPAVLFPLLCPSPSLYMSQSFCFLMGLEELQKIYINPWYSLFNSPSARQMVENFPSKLFF